MLSSCKVCFKITPPPITSSDKNFRYKVWGTIKPKRRPKPKFVAKKDTIIKQKFNQKTIKLGYKREVNLQRTRQPNIGPKRANKKGWRTLGGWEGGGGGGEIYKTHCHRSIVSYLDFTLASNFKRNFELNLKNYSFLSKPGVSLYSRSL